MNMNMNRFDSREPEHLDEREHKESLRERRGEIAAKLHSETISEAIQNEDAIKRHFEQLQVTKLKIPVVPVSRSDKLTAAIVEAMGLIEQGLHNAAWKRLKDAVEI